MTMFRILKRHQSDSIALVALLLLWLLFFWRIFTPIAADQASFEQGDFSAQFVAFGGYQYERFAVGEVPLWNPYNNGGLPFIADTQAAVFYPPRLLTIGIAQFTGGWSYNALQLEAAFHVLLFSLLMYLFVRRLTVTAPNSSIGAFIAAIIAGYGGFTSGYPPLQLALLESAVWLPLAALGILEATRNSHRPDWVCLALAGVALGLSWMAGHPQTAWFSTYVVVAWLAYRIVARGYAWLTIISSTAFVGLVTFGITAVTFLPGIEYLTLASRSDLAFAAKSGGFPVRDMIQFILPGVISTFSPLYVGIPALILIVVAVRLRVAGAWFWAGAAMIALIHSFGAHTALYHALYNLLPGLRFFRGQERAAFIIANSLAILAGIGAAYLSGNQPLRKISIGLLGLLAGITAIAVPVWIGSIGWQGSIADSLSALAEAAIISTVVAGAAYGLLTRYRHTSTTNNTWLLIGLAALITFELFSINMYPESNYDDIPTREQISMTAPDIIQTARDDMPAQPYRVDGFYALQGNYGSLYNIMDIRGISPLFLQSAFRIIYRDFIHNPVAWELFSVRYIYSERDTFSSTETDILAEQIELDTVIKLHEVLDPRPYAHLVYRADVVDSQEFAYELTTDPRYPLRDSIVLEGDPGLELPDTLPEDAQATITQYEPEAVTIDVSTSENAILSLAHVDYPGWQVTIDGVPADHLRAYNTLVAVPIPAGDHTVTLTYAPLTYRIGAILSLLTWAGVGVIAVFRLIQNWRSQVVASRTTRPV